MLPARHDDDDDDDEGLFCVNGLGNCVHGTFISARLRSLRVLRMVIRYKAFLFNTNNLRIDLFDPLIRT